MSKDHSALSAAAASPRESSELLSPDGYAEVILIYRDGTYDRPTECLLPSSCEVHSWFLSGFGRFLNTGAFIFPSGPNLCVLKGLTVRVG